MHSAQETCEEDALYTLPTGTATENLAEVFADANIQIESSGLQDGTATVADSNLAVDPDCSVQVFRVLDFNVAGQKVIPTMLQKVRGDHVAIASHKIEARDVQEDGDELKLLVTSSLAVDPRTPTRLLSTSSLMSLDMADLVKHFLKCTISRNQLYLFDGVSLPLEAYDANARACLAEMMKCDAYAGPGHTYKLLGDKVGLYSEVLAVFVAAKLVRQVSHNVFQITLKGLEALRSRTLVTIFCPALAVRDGMSLEDLTHWEMMCMLGNEEWEALVMPRGRAPAAIKTHGALDASQKKYYFTRRNLSIPRSYLQCLVSREELHKKGLSNCFKSLHKFV